jgi:hypothetical protein
MAASKTAKAQSNTEQSTPAQSTETEVKAPKGYDDERASDVIGFYDDELQKELHFVPKEVKLADNSIDEERPSCLIVGKLLGDAKLRAGKDSEEKTVDGQKGDIIGVWYKPGMKGILMCAGIPVFMFRSGEKQLKNRPQPMKVYTVKTRGEDRGKGRMIPVSEDFRDKSRDEKTPFTKGENKSSEYSDDDIPF